MFSASHLQSLAHFAFTLCSFAVSAETVLELVYACRLRSGSVSCCWLQPPEPCGHTGDFLYIPLTMYSSGFRFQLSLLTSFAALSRTLAISAFLEITEATCCVHSKDLLPICSMLFWCFLWCSQCLCQRSLL